VCIFLKINNTYKKEREHTLKKHNISKEKKAINPYEIGFKKLHRLK